MTREQVYEQIFSRVQEGLNSRISLLIKDRWTRPPDCSIQQQTGITLEMSAIQTRQFRMVLEIRNQAWEDYDDQ
jgi:hypothetical protein